MARGFRVADAFIELHLDRDGLDRDVRDIPRRLGPDVDRGGRDLGDKLSAGIRMSVVRNSPVIAAAIAGGLAAGAPLLLAGATTMFAGVGIAAAAQSQKVQSAWLGTWQQMKAGTIDAAGPIEDVLVGMAGNVGESFERMRPMLERAFTAAAPQIEQVSQSLLAMAENAMPGLVRAVEGSGPAMAGLGSALETIGTGVGAFFDKLTAHAPAAGEAMAAIGDIVGNLLPVLGEFLGQGAELASIVLPPLAKILDVAADAFGALGPPLPAIVGGFTAMKVAQSATTWIGGLVDKVKGFPAAMAATSSATGAFGVALAGTLVLYQNATAHGQKWAEMLREGGNAADAARAQMSNFGTAMNTVNSGWQGILAGLVGASATIGGTGLALHEAEQATRDWWASLDPLARAQSKVAEWSATLRDRMLDESTSASDLEAAKRRLAHWQEEAARLAEVEERAIRGVTEAMVAQFDQSRALVDSQFAYQRSVDGVEDAQVALNDAVAEYGQGSEEVQRATLALNEALSAQAAAARRVAEENLPASMDDNQRAILGAKAELDELNKIAANYALPPELEAHRVKLEQITGQADGAMLAQAQLAAAVGELGFAVSAVPGEKHVTITAPTDELRQRLADLGFTIVQLPNGDVQVVADTAEAQAKLGTLSTDLAGIDQQVATPTVDANKAPFDAVWTATMDDIRTVSVQTPTPTLNMDPSPFAGVKATAMTEIGNLAGQRPTPQAFLNDGSLKAVAKSVFQTMDSLNKSKATTGVNMIAYTAGAENALNWAARHRVSYVTQYVSTVKTKATGGKVENEPIRAATGRKVIGPGGPTDDRIPAMGPGGMRYLLSNGEQIVNAFASRMYGDALMAEVNAGTATILPSSPPALTGGASSTAVAAGVGGTSIHVDKVIVQGTFDLASSRDLRRVGEKIRDVIISLEREQR